MEDIIAIMRAERASRVARTTLPFLDENGLLEKGTAAQEGEVREWKGQKFKKQGGKWVPVTSPRKAAPKKKTEDKAGKKDESSSKPAGEKPPGGEKPQINSQEKGQLKRIKKLIESGDHEGAMGLAEGLSDDAKNVIPADVWEKMHEASTPVTKQEKATSTEKTMSQDKKERFKKWVDKNKQMFDTGEHAHPDRSKAAKFLRAKAKGFVKGLKHEIEHIKEAGIALKKIATGKASEMTSHEKKALKKVGISLGLTVATMLATGGVSAFTHGFGAAAGHLGLHFAEHGIIETALASLAFAKAVENAMEKTEEPSDKEMDQMLTQLVDSFIDWFENGDWSKLEESFEG